MSHKKRLCRKESREAGLSDKHNYHSHKAYQKAKKRILLKKLGRRSARKGRNRNGV